jgi:hypothetical protein
MFSWDSDKDAYFGYQELQRIYKKMVGKNHGKKI